MDRLAIINHLIEKNKYKSYLNIGIFTGYTLDHVKCEKKIGVDPYPQHYRGSEEVFAGTSDQFFDQIGDKKFDICFIDGMHLSEFVDRDIQNCLKCLEPNGVIILHDCNPPLKEHASRTQILPEWCGDVYKSFIKFRRETTGYNCTVVNLDYGVGIIQEDILQIKGKILNDFDEITWDYFVKYRDSLLNLITIEEFLKIYE